MKTVHIVRHSKAVGHDLGIPDFERKLEKRGSKDAKNVAARLKKRLGRPQKIVTSPALRALETARQFARQLGLKKKDIVEEQELYEADGKKVLELVNDLSDDLDSIVIVGHNPAFENFAHSLLKGFDNTLPTSAVVSVELATESWKDVKAGAGKLLAFDHPTRKKEQSEEAKAFRKNLQDELAKSISNLLKKKNGDAATQIEAFVARRAEDISRRFVKEFTTRGLPIAKASTSRTRAASKTKAPAKPASKPAKRAVSKASGRKTTASRKPAAKRTTRTPKKDDKA